MLVNLTPHPLVLRNELGEDTTIPASGEVARVASTPGLPETIEGIPVPVMGKDVFGQVVGLPPPWYRCTKCGADDPGMSDCDAGGNHEVVVAFYFVVSALVGAAIAGFPREDILVPGTGPADEAVRDGEGKIIAVTRLKRI
jgi:hypothetical protein